MKTAQTNQSTKYYTATDYKNVVSITFYVDRNNLTVHEKINMRSNMNNVGSPIGDHLILKFS